MKIMVAGGGLFGREHLASLTAIGGLDLSLAEIRDDSRAACARDFGLAEIDADAMALLDRIQPDGVIIATPAAAHEGLALACLARNTPVLVEKPVTEVVAVMERLCAAEEASRTFLQPGHILRFSTPHQQLRQILTSGEIGDLWSLSSRRYRDAAHAERYRDVDSVLMTLIHDIDLTLWFDPSGADQVTAQRYQAQGGGTLTSTRITARSGAHWDLRTAWLHPGPDLPADRIEIFGSKGSLEWEAGRGLRVFSDASRDIPASPDDPLRAELDCFLARIRGEDVSVPVTPQDALAGITLAHRIIQAL